MADKTPEEEYQDYLDYQKYLQKSKSSGDVYSKNEPENPSSLYGAVESGLEGVGKIGAQILDKTGIPKVLDYAGGNSRTDLAAAVLDKVKKQDVVNAAQANPLSGDEILKRGGWQNTSSLSDKLPFLYNNTGNGWRLQRHGWADPTGRGAAGFGLEVATDPLTYATLGLAPGLKKLSTLIKGGEEAGALRKAAGTGLNLLANPADEALVNGGKTMYKAGFKPLDAVSAQFDKTPVSDITFKYGMTGSNKSLAKQAAQKLDELSKQKSSILDQVQKAGINPDIEKAFSPASEYANQLSNSRVADQIDAAQALRNEIERQKAPLLPQEGPPGGAALATPATIQDLEKVKQSLYGGLPDSAFKSGTQAAKDLGKKAQKQMARGVKEEIENTVGKYDLGLKPEFKNINDEMGGFLTTAAAMDKQALKGANKNLLTSVDPMVFELGYGGSKGGASEGWKALIAKKLADLSKTTAVRTGVGKQMYNLGNIPGMDAFLRRQSPWMGLINDQNDKEKK